LKVAAAIETLFFIQKFSAENSMAMELERGNTMALRVLAAVDIVQRASNRRLVARRGSPCEYRERNLKPPISDPHFSQQLEYRAPHISDRILGGDDVNLLLAIDVATYFQSHYVKSQAKIQAADKKFIGITEMESANASGLAHTVSEEARPPRCSRTIPTEFDLICGIVAAGFRVAFYTVGQQCTYFCQTDAICLRKVHPCFCGNKWDRARHRQPQIPNSRRRQTLPVDFIEGDLIVCPVCGERVELLLNDRAGIIFEFGCAD
jgi:hypothetical protein